MTKPDYLQSFVKECSEAAVEATGEKFIGWEGLVSILVFEGMKLMLPELREWIKLGATLITLKRQELRNRLIRYAQSKELDFLPAERAAEEISKRVNEKNLRRIIDGLESRSR